MKHSRSFYIYLSLTILWMVVIFWFSSQPAEVSKIESGRILNILKQLYLTVTGTRLNDIFLNLVHTLVRKAGHLFEYMVLGIFTMSAVLAYLRRSEKSIQSSIKHLLSALLICILYACTDEFHQLFVPGRGGRVYDVLIDGIGSLIGISSVFQFKWSKNTNY